jgi:uncharacterized protein (TIGR03492 family)
MRLLCISNGHGEDAIALKIIQALQDLLPGLEVAALPLVGVGQSYRQAEIPIIGPTQAMPSGGFVYMDGRQLARDVKSGLLRLTWAQLQAVRRWAKAGGQVFAIGDLVPLLFAWSSGAPYAFFGTAKSEYFLRDEAGPLPKRSWYEGWAGSVYLPWERWLMARRRAQAIFVRDQLTADWLQQKRLPAQYLGNPMMDGLEPSFPVEETSGDDADRTLTLLLLPGSRPPEAHANWLRLLLAAQGIVQSQRRPLLFLAAIAASLDLAPFEQILADQGWQPQADPASPYPTYRRGNARLNLVQDAYGDCLHWADVAIATAGTATEQFVGLGKPALTLPGSGPQFTPSFAKIQARLLGPSVLVIPHPEDIAPAMSALLNDPDRLQLIAENGRRRLGQPGAAHRIAERLLDLDTP